MDRQYNHLCKYKLVNVQSLDIGLLGHTPLHKDRGIGGQYKLVAVYIRN